MTRRALIIRLERQGGPGSKWAALVIEPPLEAEGFAAESPGELLEGLALKLDEQETRAITDDRKDHR